MIRSLFILALLVSLARAEVVAIKYDHDGDYLLTISNGVATLVPVETVIDVASPEVPTQPIAPPPGTMPQQPVPTNGQVPPPPNGQVPPAPSPIQASMLEVHRQTVQQATARVQDPNKSNVKKSLSSLYKSAAKLPLAEKSQLVQATQVMFNALNLALWREWQAAVSASLASFQAPAEVKQACQVTAEVLEQPQS